MYLTKIFRKPSIYEVVILIIITIIIYYSAFGRISIIKANSHSDQDGYYLVINSKTSVINVNDYVLICIPDHKHAYVAKMEGLPSGICPFNSESLLKHVVAKSGMIVSINLSGVYINGSKLPNTAQLTNTPINLLPAHLENLRLKNEDFVVLGSNPRSFDSRYFGVINRDFIIGKAYLIWKI